MPAIITGPARGASCSDTAAAMRVQLRWAWRARHDAWRVVGRDVRRIVHAIRWAEARTDQGEAWDAAAWLAAWKRDACQGCGRREHSARCSSCDCGGSGSR